MTALEHPGAVPVDPRDPAGTAAGLVDALGPDGALEVAVAVLVLAPGPGRLAPDLLAGAVLDRHRGDLRSARYALDVEQYRRAGDEAGRDAGPDDRDALVAWWRERSKATTSVRTMTYCAAAMSAARQTDEVGR